MKKNGLTYGKQTGFQIPPDYMENLEARLFSKMNSSEDKAPDMEKAEKVYTVPPNYFESFEDRLMEKLPVQRKEPKLISLLNKEAFYYVAGVAAVLVAVVLGPVNSQPEPSTMDTIDMLSLETYIDESMDRSAPEVSNMFSEELFSYAPADHSENIDQEAVIDYLHENLEEPSLIFNED